MQDRRNRYCWLIGALSATLWTGCIVDDVELAESVARTQAPLLGADAAGVIDGDYIVVFHEDTAAAAIEASRNRVALAGDASRVMRSYSVIPGFSARLSPAALDALRRNPEVAYVEADQTVTALATAEAIHPAPSEGNDRTDQCTGADGSYDDHGLTGSNAHVYVLDTGIRSTHTEFTGRVIRGATMINDGRGIEDCQGHGTHVSSLAVGTQYGMAKQAIVHPVRVLDCNGSGTTSGVIAGVDFVTNDCPKQSGRCVANMSLGGGSSSSLDTAVKNGIASGVPFVVSAGSDACSSSPGRVPEAITVAKACPSDPTCVDILAPGSSILGATIGSDTAAVKLSGDSMSAGLTSGAVAMHLSANPSATPADVDAAMKASAVVECGCSLGRLYNDFSSSLSCPACTNSCAGRCGDYNPAATCQCDDACTSFGDCCADKAAICS